MRLDDAIAAAGDLLLGARCPGCDQAGAGVCARCLAGLAEPVRPVRRDGIELPPTWAAGAHAGARRGLVVALKERQAWTLVGLLGDELARACAAAVLAADVPRVTLVPIPSAPKAVRQRGLDTTAAITRAAVTTLRAAGVAATIAQALRQRPGARDQAGLGADARFANLRRRLECSGVPKGAVLVTDDIVTTGASLAESARCLTMAGADVVGCAVVAARGWR